MAEHWHTVSNPTQELQKTNLFVQQHGLSEQECPCKEMSCNKKPQIQGHFSKESRENEMNVSFL